jgi:DNA processing protein
MAPDAVAELTAWLRLLLTPGIGRAGARQLLAAFGTPQAVFDASRAARQQCLGQTMLTDEPPAALPSTMAALLDWLEAAGGRDWVALGDARYPQALLQTADPPLLLYTQGDVELLNSPCLAIVGSRNPTPQGAENARAFAEHLGAPG